MLQDIVIANFGFYLSFTELSCVAQLDSGHLADISDALSALEQVLLEQAALLHVKLPSGEDCVHATALLSLTLHDVREVEVLFPGFTFVRGQGPEAPAREASSSEIHGSSQLQSLTEAGFFLAASDSSHQSERSYPDPLRMLAANHGRKMVKFEKAFVLLFAVLAQLGDNSAH